MILKNSIKDQVTAATLVTAVHQIEQNANTLNQAMHGLREVFKITQQLKQIANISTKINQNNKLRSSSASRK